MSLEIYVYITALTPEHPDEIAKKYIDSLPSDLKKFRRRAVSPSGEQSGGPGASRNRCYAAHAIDRYDDGPDFCTTEHSILCLPVRTRSGTFAYVTSPDSLGRFIHDMDELEDATPYIMNPLPKVAMNGIILADNSKLNVEGKVSLAEIDLIVNAHENVTEIAVKIGNELLGNYPPSFVERFAMVDDGIFSFLCETEMFIYTGIPLKSDGTISEELCDEDGEFANTMFWGKGYVKRAGKSEAPIVGLNTNTPFYIHNGSPDGFGSSRTVYHNHIVSD